MGCPSIGVLNQNLTFSSQLQANTGAPVDADGDVSYSVYEDETGTAIATGTMAKLDDAGTTGFYSEQISLTAANGFERYKSYNIRVTAVIGGVSVATVYNFLCLGGSDTFTATTDALTTLDNYKDYCGISVTTYDTLITALINRASNAIHKYCHRIFTDETYREIRSGDGYTELMLNEYPIISIQLLCTQRQSCMYITNSSSDAYNAYIQINDTYITLVQLGGTNAGSNQLTLADYDTLTDLETAINALAGWTADVTASYALWAPVELLPQSGLQCLNSYAYPEIPYDPATDFTFDDEAGIIYLPTGFSKGTKNVTIKYTAGYETIPADLEQICIDLIKVYYDDKGKDAVLKSEKIGDYSYTKFAEGSDGLPNSIKSRLSGYVRRTL